TLRHLRRILVPTHGSPGAARALSAALPLAPASGASLTLLQLTDHIPTAAYTVAKAGELGSQLHVGREYEEAERVRAEDAVRHIAKQLVENGYDATGIACVGDPSTAI